jgi:hypothetical protein
MEKIDMENFENLDIDLNTNKKNNNNNNQLKKNLKNSGSNGGPALEFTLSNPLKIELVKHTIKKNQLEFELEISYKAEKWKIIKKLEETITLIRNLKSENFCFLKENYFLKNFEYYSIDPNNLEEINSIILNLKNFFNYINYRFDILLNIHTKEYLKINSFAFNEELSSTLKAETLNKIFSFAIDTSDLTMSDFDYDSSSGILILGLEDVSILSTIGRFWSMIDYEILGSILVYQRVYDENEQPYFKKITGKSFDARVSKTVINSKLNKIYVGLDNGTIQVFTISIIEKKGKFTSTKTNTNTNNTSTNTNSNININNNKDNNHNNCTNNSSGYIDIINESNLINLNIEEKANNNNPEEENITHNIIFINENIIFKPLTERITGLAFFHNFLFISSKENKLVILEISEEKPQLRFNGSLKKRMEGKGYIKDIFINLKTKNLFVNTQTDKILIYKISYLSDTGKKNSEICIEYFNEINTNDKIRNYFLGDYNLFIATENKIEVCDLKKIKEISGGNFNNSLNNNNDWESNIIPFDGSLDSGISISTNFMKLDYYSGNTITSLSYFCDMKIILLGLSNGNLIAVSSKSLEVIFAKKISENSLTKMILLEENYVVIISDENGNIFFYQFGC